MLTMVQFLPEGATVEREYSSTKLTYADYALFPDDGLRHEIIGGDHYVTPSPATRHQRISRNLLHLIQCYLDIHPIGEVFSAPFDVLLSEWDVVVPDLIYLSRERAHFLTPKNLQGPPDLVVEILSRSTRSRDRELKRVLYERVGTQEYWLVDPEREAVDAYRRGAGGFQNPIRYARTDTLSTPLLPGLDLQLDRVLA
jgi:Uma2 family endonuclease